MPLLCFFVGIIATAAMRQTPAPIPCAAFILTALFAHIKPEIRFIVFFIYLLIFYPLKALF